MRGLHIAMIIVWGMVGLAIVAFIIGGVVFRNSSSPRFGFDFSISDNENMGLAVDETVAAGSLNEIDIGLSSDECTVFFTDSDSVNVKHYVRNISEQDYARVTSSGGRLDISTKPISARSFFGFGISRRSRIEVYIPKSYKEKLAVDLTSGDIRFTSGTELSGLDVHISSGTVRAAELIKAKDTNITITSGDIRFSGGLVADKYIIKASSGTIDIDGQLVGSGSVNVTSGTIRLSGVDIADSLSVGASSGTINIEIAGNPSLDFTGRKSSGTLRTYFDALHDDHGRYSAKVGEGPYKTLDVQVTSGTVRINSAD